MIVLVCQDQGFWQTNALHLEEWCI